MGRPVNLKEIEAFRAVMHTGTTTAAAEFLHVSQPAVSRLISRLEDRCNTRLFVRTHGRLMPTREAEALLHEVELFYTGLNRIDGFLTGMDALKVGHLRILATSPMAHGLLPTVFARFREDYPGATIALEIVPRRQMRGWLEGQHFDVGLVTLPIEYPSSDSKPLVEVQGVCVLPPGHRLAARAVIEARDLSEESFISASPQSPTRHMIDQLLGRANVRCRRITETHSAVSICKMVAAGMGVSLVDPFTARDFQVNGVVLRPFRPVFTYEFGLVFPIQRPRSRLADVFVEYVRNSLSETAGTFQIS